MKSVFMKVLGLIFLCSRAHAYTVDQAGAGDFTTIQACAQAARAGDTCVVNGGTYDERVKVLASGVAGNPIVFKAAAGSRATVRAFTINGSYVTVDGFEITNIGMSYELEYHGGVIISGGTGVRILNNDIHDTNFSCVGYGKTSFLDISNNRLDRCGVSNAIIGEAGGPYTITTGVNDQMKFTLNDAVTYSVTLTPGAARTSSQICADVNAVSNAPAIPWGSAVACAGLGADGRIQLYARFSGPDTAVVLDDISNNAYATLGLKVGSGVPIGHSSAFLALTDPSSDVLIQNNRVSHVSDYLLPKGQRFVFRNNVLGPSDPANTIHIDGVQSNAPCDFLLIEGNRTVDNTSSDNHFMLTSANSNNWIVRHNSSLRSKGGVAWGCGACGTQTHLAHYNNTWYNTVDYYYGWSQIGLTNAVDNLSRNNIFYRAVRHPGGNPYYVGAGSTLDHDYDLVFQSGDAKEAHQIFSDPLFKDASSGDFGLQELSPARDTGGPLTEATNSGFNSFSLTVKAAYAFQDGWAGTEADWIAVGTTENVAKIARIDYARNTIVLQSVLSWPTGAPVWLFGDSSGKRVLYGSAADRGAAEYCGNNCQSTMIPSAAPSSDLIVYPFKNVFNPGRGENVTLTYHNPTDSQMEIKIYDRRGHMIRQLDAGIASALWDGHNSAGTMVASGIYVLVVNAGNNTIKKKVVVLK